MQESRTRVDPNQRGEGGRVDPQRTDGAGTGGGSQPIANPRAVGGGGRAVDDDMMGRSPHDMRFAEREFFSLLVEQTASSLIDIAQTPEFLSVEDAKMRQQDYASLLATVQPAPALDALLALPAASHANGDDMAALLLAPSPAQDAHLDLLSRGTALLGEGLKAVDVDPAPIGDIVTVLPEVSSD